jgi:secondary thiamine-phosphate synthase enzyme
MITQDTFIMTTAGRGTTDITARVDDIVAASGIHTGTCHVFVQHTSASLMLCENADPAVRRDMERFMSRMVPDGDPMFSHDTEGPDDMPAHVRTLLTGPALTLPVSGGRSALGTWQGIYLWEHRYRGTARSIVVTVQGE